MFKDKYHAIYDQVSPDESLLAATLALDNDRAGQKSKQIRQSNRIIRFAAIPAGAVASFVIIFVLMVNLSPDFTLAMEQIPVLRSLAAVVSFSPSLNSAVENDYLQVIGEEQTVNDITMRIEYVIVDRKQLHVFFSFHSERYFNMFPTEIALLDTDGLPLQGYISFASRTNVGFWSDEVAQDDLRHYIFNFTDTEVPDSLILESGVFDSFESGYEPDDAQTTEFTNIYRAVPISTFSIPIAFDTGLVQHGETIAINRDISIDGFVLSINSIEILPTHTRINITEHEQNSAWLMDISCYLIDETGNRFNPTGYSRDMWRHEQKITTYHLESVFFAESQHLSLIITDAVWLCKNVETTRIDLVNIVADNLPPHVELMSIEKINNDWALVFSAPNREQKFYDPFYDEMARWAYNLFNTELYDETGNSHSFAYGSITNDGYERWRFYTREEVDIEMELGFNTGWVYGVSGFWEKVETPGAFGWTSVLRDYPFDTLFLTSAFSQLSVLDTPIEITVR
jgi:hypothetical protein